MRKKCKVCKALLDNERCSSCGAYNGIQPSSQSVDLNEDIPTSDIPGFDMTPELDDTDTTMLLRKPERLNPALIFVIIFALSIASFLWFFLINRPQELLLGAWENGRGSIFLVVFAEADSAEFLENGTIIITQEGSRRSLNWESIAPNTFIADGEQFSYSINGDILVITDRWDDNWTFDRIRDE